MFRWRNDKNRVKAVFKLHFHVTQVAPRDYPCLISSSRLLLSSKVATFSSGCGFLALNFDGGVNVNWDCGKRRDFYFVMVFFVFRCCNLGWMVWCFRLL